MGSTVGLDLSSFELPPAMVRPALEACRLFNTALDLAFYDVPSLLLDLRSRHEDVVTLARRGIASAAEHFDFDALANPEGSILVVDAERQPYIRAFSKVGEYLACKEPEVAGITVATVTGVGSSALGSAALAWNASEALRRPVLAIVPGYGVADALLQGLGGWFGFGLHDLLATKSWLQTGLGLLAPELATIGRTLSASVPGSAQLPNGAPVFRHGSGSSDVLHALLEHRLELRCVIGHSKGALVIANALRSLAAGRNDGMTIVTLGCPIAAEHAMARYYQYLGLFDALGALNAWGNGPSRWLLTDHSTNTSIPLSMAAERLVGEDGLVGS